MLVHPSITLPIYSSISIHISTMKTLNDKVLKNRLTAIQETQITDLESKGFEVSVSDASINIRSANGQNPDDAVVYASDISTLGNFDYVEYNRDINRPLHIRIVRFQRA